jgi:hypothetical protein
MKKEEQTCATRQYTGARLTLREGFHVWKIIREALHYQRFQRSLIHCVTRATRIKNIIHVAHVGKTPTQQERRLCGLVAMWKMNASVGGRTDFLAFQVVTEVFNKKEQIVSPNVEPIILV